MPDPNKTISVPMFDKGEFEKILNTPLLPTQILPTQIERNIIPDEIQGLKDRVINIENTIKHIFGNHVLINGKWVVVK